MNIFRVPPVLLLICGIAACGPVYKTDYTLTPPSSPSGKECANHCYYEREGCMNACGSYAMSCAPGGGFSTSFGYGSFGHHSFTGVGIGTGYPLYDPYRYYDYCSDNRDICAEQCESTYRACFAACGGKVTPNTVCVQNCPAP